MNFLFLRALNLVMKIEIEKGRLNDNS
jgi:hypothetical protein